MLKMFGPLNVSNLTIDQEIKLTLNIMSEFTISNTNFPIIHALNADL